MTVVPCVLVKKIFLIGTSHALQLRTPQISTAAQESFKSLVANTCARHRARLIAEEMSDEALQNRGATQTICGEIAAEAPDTGHLLVDPNIDERRQLGIENVDHVPPEIFHTLHMQSARATSLDDLRREADIRAAADPRVRSSHDKREKEWVRRLELKNQFPILLVCGANHVQSFSELAENMGFVVTVLHADWHPSFPIYSE